VIDIGGATRPAARRRKSPRNMIKPATTTIAIITIQVAATLSWPLSMSLTMLLCRLITPPTPMLPVALIR
jgi:hypothetical protein